MSATVNGEFHLRETWVFQGYARDHQSQPLDLTEAEVKFRMATSKGEIIFDLSTPTGGVVLEPTLGTYQFVIDPDEQDHVSPGNYRFEVRVILSNGRNTVQNLGTITVLPTLFNDE